MGGEPVQIRWTGASAPPSETLVSHYVELVRSFQAAEDERLRAEESAKTGKTVQALQARDRKISRQFISGRRDEKYLSSRYHLSQRRILQIAFTNRAISR